MWKDTDTTKAKLKHKEWKRHEERESVSENIVTKGCLRIISWWMILGSQKSETPDTFLCIKIEIAARYENMSRGYCSKQNICKQDSIMEEKNT